MKNNKNLENCPFHGAMELFSGKWTMTIINNLMSGKMRYTELSKSIPGINTRMLVKTLKELEAKKIVKRKAFATVPPTVEYSLTDKGLSLKSVITEIQNWAIKNI